MRATTSSAALGLLLLAGPAFAQQYPTMASDPTNALYAQGGLSVGSSDTGGTISLAFAHDFSDRLGLEVAGGYLDRGRGVSAWSGSASLLLYLLPSSQDFVPYLAAGGGFYRTSLDLGHPRFSGWPDADPWMSGWGMYGPMFAGRGSWGGMWEPGQGGHLSSTDPLIPLGGGLRWAVTGRLSLRADARALVVPAADETFTVGVFTLGVGLRF